MRKLSLIIFLCTLLLSGCFGNEPNDTAYIAALGVDMAQNGNYDITIQFARPKQISGGSSEEGGKGGEGIVENISIEAPDVYSALNIANHIVSKKFSLAHAKLVVFSSEMAKNGVRDIIESLGRSDEIRPDLICAVSRETAREYLENAQPLVELNPAKYYQLIYEENESGGVPKKTGLEVIFEITGDHRDTVMPLSGVAKATEEGKQKSEGESQSDSSSQSQEKPQSEAPVNTEGFQYKTRNYKAGEVKLLQKDKSEVLGMAVFKGDRLVAELGETEADIYNILNGDYKNNYTSFYNEENPEKAVSVLLSQRNKPVYKVDKKEKKVKIKLNLEGNLYLLPYDYELESEIEDFEKNTAEAISKKSEEFVKIMRDEYGADVFGIGEKARGCFVDLKEFNEYNWDEKFRDYEIEVETNFKIRHSGIMYRRKK